MALVVAILLPWAALAADGPYTPTSDDEVLERLPVGLRSADLRRERAALADDPENLRDSVSMAWSYLETARSEGDARFLGYTQSILAPWWHLTSPPEDVRLARAAVFEITLELDRALAELDTVLSGNPDLATALAARREVCLERGDIAGARKALEAGRAAMSSREATLADARCDRWTGRLGEAVVSLEAILAEDGGGSVAERYATLALLAELLMQQGRWDDAGARFAEMRRLGKRDVRVLALEAEFDLRRGRFEDVMERLKGETGHDGLAVRLLEAWNRRDAADPAEAERRAVLQRQVEKRLADRRARGDASALPDALRYWLRVRLDPEKAVERAGELWAIRRTLDDARLILEAARLDDDDGLASRVTDWLERTGVTDARLDGLLRGSRKEALP